MCWSFFRTTESHWYSYPSPLSSLIVSCVVTILLYLLGRRWTDFPLKVLGVNNSRLGALIVSFSKSKLGMLCTSYLQNLKNDILDVQRNIVHVCLRTVVFGSFKGQTRSYIWPFKGQKQSYLWPFKGEARSYLWDFLICWTRLVNGKMPV